MTLQGGPGPAGSALLRHRVQLARVAHPCCATGVLVNHGQDRPAGREAPGRDWLAGLEFRPWAIAPRV